MLGRKNPADKKNATGINRKIHRAVPSFASTLEKNVNIFHAESFRPYIKMPFSAIRPRVFKGNRLEYCVRVGMFLLFFHSFEQNLYALMLNVTSSNSNIRSLEARSERDVAFPRRT